MKVLDFYNKYPKICLVFFLLIILTPHFIININGDNYWGGDFSQYIQQALNLINDGSQATNYYIFNPNYSELAPPNYYPGFPLILSPVLAFYGLDFIVLTKFMTFLMILMAIVWFLFLQRQINKVLSFVIVVFAFYTPFFFEFKNLIISDIPFTIFLTLALIFISKIENLNKFSLLNFIGLLISVIFSILIKPLGFVLIISMFVYGVVVFLFKKENYKIILIQFGLVSIVSVLAYLLLIPLLLGVTKSQDSHFFSLFAWQEIVGTTLSNLAYYYTLLLRFFNLNIDGFTFFNFILTQLIGLSFIYGLFKYIKTHFNFFIIYFFIFVSIILLFPYSQGVRYLLPIMPIILLFIIYGMIKAPFRSKSKIIAITILVFIGYVLPLRVGIVNYAKKNENYQYHGAFTEKSKELFSFISKHTDKEDVIIFNKPRVLGLFSQRKSFCVNEGYRDLELINKEVKAFNSRYLIKMINNYPKITFDIFLKNNKVDTVFNNDKFIVVEIIEE